MPAKKTKKRPVKRAKKPAVKAPLWSAADVALLRREVAKGPSAAAAFVRVGKATRRRPETVQAKWYQLQKGNRSSVLSQRTSKRSGAKSDTRVSVGSFDLEMGKLLGMLEASDVSPAIKAQAERVWRVRQ